MKKQKECLLMMRIKTLPSPPLLLILVLVVYRPLMLPLKNLKGLRYLFTVNRKVKANWVRYIEWSEMLVLIRFKFIITPNKIGFVGKSNQSSYGCTLCFWEWLWIFMNATALSIIACSLDVKILFYEVKIWCSNVEFLCAWSFSLC